MWFIFYTSLLSVFQRCMSVYCIPWDVTYFRHWLVEVIGTGVDIDKLLMVARSNIFKDEIPNYKQTWETQYLTPIQVSSSLLLKYLYKIIMWFLLKYAISSSTIEMADFFLVLFCFVFNLMNVIDIEDIFLWYLFFYAF